MPVERGRQEAAEQHADASPAGSDKAEYAHRFGALSRFGEQVHGQRKPHRRDNGTTDPLYRPRRNEQLLRGRQAAGKRCQREKCDPDQEKSAMAEKIAQPSAKQ